jgi:hypothetical protein
MLRSVFGLLFDPVGKNGKTSWPGKSSAVASLGDGSGRLPTWRISMSESLKDLSWLAGRQVFDVSNGYLEDLDGLLRRLCEVASERRIWVSD